METRSSKADPTKEKYFASTPNKSGKRAEQIHKVKPDVGSLDKPGRKKSQKTRELESLQNIADGRQATIMDFTPKK